MHPEARDFMLFVKQQIGEFFRNKSVLDVGSGDINGNNRFLFDNCTYEGNDVFQAPNVTVVSKTSALHFDNNTFDTIVSTECFEHDPEYVASFQKIVSMLRPGGLFCFTCASTGRPEHGTRRTSPGDSWGTIGDINGWQDYYKNLEFSDLNNAIPVVEIFSQYAAYYNATTCDLYFWGIKGGASNVLNVPVYIAPGVVQKNLLSDIFEKYDTDKKASFHNYTRQYEGLFRDVRDKPIKYLEIGVYNGGSIHAMREVFTNATCLVGIDIDSRCKTYEDTDKNVFVEIGNATDLSFINMITEKYGTFDVILDDGSHINKDVISTFESLYPLLNDDGLYIVEDTICYKSQHHLVNGYANHLQYFFNYTQFLNQWRYDSTEGIKDHCVDPFKIMKKTTNIFEASIDKIEYGCSYIAIHKKIRAHWL